MDSRVLDVRTGGREIVHDLTRDCEQFLDEIDAGDGLLHVWVPHATAGLAVLETGAGSDTDLLAALRELLPPDDRWRHRHGSPGHGRDHVLPALCPPYASVPVVEGADGARHLAVGVPGRPQRGQPGPPGPAVLPRQVDGGVPRERLAPGPRDVWTYRQEPGRPAEARTKDEGGTG